MSITRAYGETVAESMCTCTFFVLMMCAVKHHRTVLVVRETSKPRLPANNRAAAATAASAASPAGLANDVGGSINES